MAGPFVRVGVDVVLVPRMAELSQQEGFIRRVFQSAELDDTRPEHLAGLLAAKEACFKALGVPSRWHDVVVVESVGGRPTLLLGASLGAPELASLDLSIAHEGPFAVAVVVALLLGEADSGAR